MATPLSAARQLDALRLEGCKVTEYRDWRSHNRNHKGSWGPVNGVMIHHTVTSGTAGSVELCYQGHSTLPGPLCHGVIAKDGALYMVGCGRANHAGWGDGDVYQAVVNERELPAPNERTVDGNRHFYGFECVNLGDGRDPWPEVQIEAIARTSAALCRAHGWNERSVIGHAEWTNQKIDPRGPGKNAQQFMDEIRTRVRELLAAPPGDDVEEEETMHPIGEYETDDEWLKPGEWKTLDIDGVDVLKDATLYNAFAHITGEFPEGSTIQGRFYHLRPDGSRWDGPIIERFGSGGSTFADFPNGGSIRKEERLRFEAIYYPVDKNDTSIRPIRTMRVRGTYQK